MRGLTTRNVRPCLQHNKFAFSTPPIRRTTFPPLQRAVTCADAFLFFLPSVLTAALVVDYTGKERKRAEWDHQIALAQEEADRLKQRQLESWSRIQRRSVSHGAWQQRRSLFTASRTARFVEEERDEEREERMDPLGRREEFDAMEEPADPDSDVEPRVQQTTDEYIKKQERFGRLIATRLALEMMLRLRRARSPLYRPKPTVDTTDKTFYQSMDFIVQELDKVLDLIQALEIQKVPWDVEMPMQYYMKQSEMGHRILVLSEQYRRAEIHLPDYIMSFVQLVTDYKIGPPNWGYVIMMRALAYHQSESRMARHVEDAIFDNHVLLDSYTISNILFHYGAVLDSVRFNEFLDRMTRADNHPRPANAWYRLNVDDINVCVPRSKNGHIITGLIRTALMCRQQTVAEAYATLFIDRDRVEKYSGIHKWFVLGNFLQAYGEWNSWKAGKKWLQTVLDWMSELTAEKEHVLGRVILRMLDFCVCCGKKDDYEAIMSAVVAAHFQLPIVDPEKKLKVTPRMAAIRLDWSERIRDLIDFDPMGRDSERIERFKSMLGGRWDPQNSSSEEKRSASRKRPWAEEGYLPYRPFERMAADRLEEATKRRQQEVNHGFKNVSFPPRSVPFTVDDQESPEDAFLSEVSPRQLSTDSEQLEFSSPFFHDHSEAVSMPYSNQMNGTSNNDRTSDSTTIQPTDLDPIKLKEALEATRRRLRQVEEQNVKEVALLKRHLKDAQARLREVTVTPYTPLSEGDDDDNEVAKSSATG